jgi:transcriptional regulator with XRE-family HTH domain
MTCIRRSERILDRHRLGGAWAEPECLPRRGGSRMSTAVARILDDLRAHGGLQGKDIANIVNVSTATVSRWARGSGTPNLRTQTIIAELRYVVDRLSDFYTPDETRLWLHSRHPLLNGERAIDLIYNGRLEEVLAIIERLEAGAYV